MQFWSQWPSANFSWTVGACLLCSVSHIKPITELLFTFGTERAVYKDDYMWASIVVAGTCLLALLVRGSIFAARIVTNLKQGNHWYSSGP